MATRTTTTRATSTARVPSADKNGTTEGHAGFLQTKNMNNYRYQFVSLCPTNGDAIIYTLEIQSKKMIHVEHIITAAALHKSNYHENIADDFINRFGGHQTITALHHGVEIITVREAK
ncbi:hypothetical protein UNDYM_1621 [Undibacterium sp. YM2]|nr:hypothetical protein UNDYM_1621 [Undibacterium sp. YM2]